jgi:putative ABC transport system permease protein
MALTGIAIGIVVAVALSRFLGAFLYGVTPLEPLVYALCGASVLVVTAVASLVPALAARRLAPAAVLRED